ncbi:Uncharacterized protein TCM_014310 [Theobroma cacao]|uniref:Uncharacterized protein n=1 Tax=Theobroma cacao TaxID=3641 RepID=A0A061FXX9_THECC|nr:Uncharacterized protein TCM_014310 [Theobroma cacao]
MNFLKIWLMPKLILGDTLVEASNRVRQVLSTNTYKIGFKPMHCLHFDEPRTHSTGNATRRRWRCCWRNIK